MTLPSRAMSPAADSGVETAARLAAAMRPGRLRVGVIGTGRAGSALAAALDRAGHRIVAGTTSARELPLFAELGELPRLPADEVAALADLVLVTVPDDILADLVRGLAVTGAIKPGQIVVHAAGRYGLDVLAPATQAGALPIALHPAMTFSGGAADLARLGEASIAVTAPPQFRVVGEALAIELGGEPVFVPDELRTLWHAALTHGANHLVTLVGQCVDLLTTAGVAEPERVLGPLMSAALDNALRQGDAGLTGPISRGDAGTVAAHVRDLATSPARDAYLALARATVERAAASGRLNTYAADDVRCAIEKV
jgi:predicted short-subunit dehydrogenase-like oxidoreductase (DUF2520 family)